MTDWGRPGGEPTTPAEPTMPAYPTMPAHHYPGPPPTEPYVPPAHGSGQYGSPVYPSSGYPAPQPPANPYAQMPPYGYGYPPGYGPQPGDGRPGTTIAAAVLGYVGGGLLILAGVLLFFGASFVTSIDNASGNDHGSFAGQLSVLGVVNLIAAGLLIAGSVSLTGRSARGRSMYSIGASIVVVLSVIWTAWWTDRSNGGVVIYALMFAAIVIVGLCLARTRAGTAWLGGATRT